MAALMLILMDVRDPSWLPDYVTQVPPILERHGGKLIGRSLAPVRLEGSIQLPQSVAVIQFPSMADLQQFMDSPDYKPFRDARRQGSEAQILAIESEI